MKIYGVVVLLCALSAHASEPSDEDTARAWSKALAINRNYTQQEQPKKQPSASELIAPYWPIIVDAQKEKDAKAILELLKKAKKEAKKEPFGCDELGTAVQVHYIDGSTAFSPVQEEILVMVQIEASSMENLKALVKSDEVRKKNLNDVLREIPYECLKKKIENHLKWYARRIATQQCWSDRIEKQQRVHAECWFNLVPRFPDMSKLPLVVDEHSVPDARNILAQIKKVDIKQLPGIRFLDNWRTCNAQEELLVRIMFQPNDRVDIDKCLCCEGARIHALNFIFQERSCEEITMIVTYQLERYAQRVASNSIDALVQKQKETR